MNIPFNKPYQTGLEISYISEACQNGHLSGDGPFSKKCHQLLEEIYSPASVLLTHSCTAALEMSALLIDIQPGDEVILPSYTFVSTANAFVLYGAKPVFVDIRADSLNIDEALIEQAITSKTKAIVVVHYAGMSCNMDKISMLAKKHKLFLIEDAAQAIGSRYRDQPVGVYGDLATLSFHETKNISSGEGGALIINNRDMTKRAHIIREKGTNRTAFFKGEVDKYTWVDKGSSYLPSELTAAYLYAQLTQLQEITQARLKIWNTYHKFFEKYEALGQIKRPSVLPHCEHNSHIYYLIFNSLSIRDLFIQHLKSKGILCVFHYIPLHLSPFGSKHGRNSDNLEVTCHLYDKLVRLPLWIGIDKYMDEILYNIQTTLEKVIPLEE